MGKDCHLVQKASALSGSHYNVFKRVVGICTVSRALSDKGFGTSFLKDVFVQDPQTGIGTAFNQQMSCCEFVH